MYSKKGFVIPLIIAIVAILAIGGSVYFSKNKKVEAPVINPVASSTVATSTATSTDVTAGWKTYTNIQLGYQIKYPKDSILTVDDTNLGDAGHRVVNEFPSNSPYMTISLKNSSVSICKECGPGYGPGIGDTKIEESINIDGKNYIANGWKSSTNKILYVYTPNLTIIYSYSQDKNRNDVEQILSTFKFTTLIKTSCTPNWQCGWGECKNGYQGMTAVDSNNCGLPSNGVQIVCPALARLCIVSSSGLDGQMGYIKNIYQKDGKYYLDIDYIQWINGTKNCQNYGKSSEDGYCIINDNPLIRTFEIDPNSSIRTVKNITSAGKFDGTISVAGSTTTIDLLVNAYNNSNGLYNISIDTTSNKIVSISEQYRP